MKVDPRFLVADGPEVFTGNELLVKGALEAEGGVHLLGGYPGSPVADFFSAMASVKDLLNDKGIRAVINNNEALAAAMANGTQTVACRAIIAMKSVGVHVAADALALGNLAGAHPDGGVIVVYGDDPWSDSTQVPADSRYISKHLFIPVIEPADAQEVKDFVGLSLKLSRMSELYAGYIITTNLADGGGTVACRPNCYPAFNANQRIAVDTAAINLDKRVLLPPRTWWQEESLPHRLQRAVAAARSLGLNRIQYPAQARKALGFVASGLAHGYLTQALLELGLLGEYPILKFGLSYPVDEVLVRELSRQCERIVVVEERRDFMEEQIGQVQLKDRQAGVAVAEVWGKRFPDGLAGIPATRGLHPSILIERLVPLLRQAGGRAAQVNVPVDFKALTREMDTILATASADVEGIPARLPTFCPGCPHRDTADLCLEIKKSFLDPAYMARRHKLPAVDLLFHGDTGCYTMLMFPPNQPLMHDYSGMGLGGGTGAGTDPFLTNKEVVFMGDSTFFHSGQIAISQAVKFGQDITFIILDNSTTGMTGHQPTPGVDYDILGKSTAVQDIEEVVGAMGGTSGMKVLRADPQQRKQYRRLLEETFLADGVKVIIATKECGITRMRRKRRLERDVLRRRGFLPAWEHVNVNQGICRFCLSCAEMTGCPGLKHVETDYGRKIDTDLTWCVADGACERIGACSAFERVTIRRKRPPRTRVPELGLEEIPEPQKRPLPPGAAGWRCCLTGVGGMGVGMATGILVRAGHNEGYPVVFVDRKGLAIRNGGVFSQVVYNTAKLPVTALIPYGKADLLIGIDVLEAARSLDPRGRLRVASADRTAAVINTAKVDTSMALMGHEDFDVEVLERMIRQHTRAEDYLARDISRICEKYLGSKQYANIMMLGFAFQKGLIPVSMHSMAWAIKDTIRADFRKNLYAFNMGRKLVVQADLFQGPPKRTDWRDVLEEKCRFTIRRYRRGQRKADALRELVAGTIKALQALDEDLKRAVVVRLYDCMRWGGLDYARHYARGVQDVFAKDNPRFAYAATRAAVYNLAAAMLVKDAVFLAELATSPEKYARDREKYNVNRANGDRITYRHCWHGRIRLGGTVRAVDVTLRPWALQVLKRSTWLRKVLPGWGRSQRQFLRGYLGLIDHFAWSSGEEYQQALAGLSSPQCMDCMNPRCQELGCPLASRIPLWVQLACEGQWRQASQVLHERNNFPEFTAEVCPAFCQDSCKQGLNGFAVQVRDLEKQVIERAFREGWVVAQPDGAPTGKKVAVVGAGPAGLAAAQQLARAGHEVAVFDKQPQPGGLLRYGIPAFRLSKHLIDRRVEQLKAEGVKFHAGVEVGKDVSAAELRAQFDAVLLTAGASRSRDLDIPGRCQQGVHLAIDYLRQAATAGAADAVSAKDKVVAVLGGGLTGADCVETALRQGAREVHQFEILPRPAGGEGQSHGPSEKVHRRWCVATKQFGGQGRLTDLSGAAVQWLPSANGKTMREIPGSEFRMKVDLALLALGFDPVLEGPVAEQLGLARDARGAAVVQDCATSVPGVFAAGDLVTGASYVARAIDSGRKAAEKIDAYLAAKRA